MRILLDTNLLVRISETGHSDHATARNAIVSLRRQNHTLCLVTQILYEFWPVATRPLENNGLSMTIEKTEAALTEARSFFLLLRDERAIYEHWEQLVVQSRVRGKKAHDARVVAAMNRHGITNLLTFNAQDFARYDGIEVIVPRDVETEPAAE